MPAQLLNRNVSSELKRTLPALCLSSTVPCRISFVCMPFNPRIVDSSSREGLAAEVVLKSRSSKWLRCEIQAYARLNSTHMAPRVCLRLVACSSEPRLGQVHLRTPSHEVFWVAQRDGPDIVPVLLSSLIALISGTAPRPRYLESRPHNSACISKL